MKFLNLWKLLGISIILFAGEPWRESWASGRNRGKGADPGAASGSGLHAPWVTSMAVPVIGFLSWEQGEVQAGRFKALTTEERASRAKRHEEIMEALQRLEQTLPRDQEEMHARAIRKRCMCRQGNKLWEKL